MAFIGSIGAWMLMLVVYSASITFAAVPKRRRRIAVLDEELAGIVERLQPLCLVEQRLARQLGVRSAVIADLQRVRGLLALA